MKPFYSIIIVMPVGPNSSIDFIEDTINSFAFFTRSSYKIIIADDSHQQTGEAIQERFADVDVLKTHKPMGGMIGLYFNLSKAYKHALEHYDFDLIFKLDTDALIINNEPEKEALKLFADDEMMGIAGQYPNEYNGKPWDRSWPRDRVLNGAITWRYIRRPFANIELRKFFINAVDNGYKPGESVFGGAYYIGKSFLQKLDEKGLLPSQKLKTLNLGEDHIFSLLAKAHGFQLGNLASGNLPFACAWKGLPASPEELYAHHKKIIHSTKQWQHLNEREIRNYFKEKRKEQKDESPDNFYFKENHEMSRSPT